VSVLDSGFLLGDGVWEGIRVHKGAMVFAQQHLERLYQGAKALDMDLALSPAQLAQLVYQTLDANGMHEASGGSCGTAGAVGGGGVGRSGGGAGEQ
jgi:branched-chain amino acid aminotransferase